LRREAEAALPPRRFQGSKGPACGEQERWCRRPKRFGSGGGATRRDPERRARRRLALRSRDKDGGGRDGRPSPQTLRHRGRRGRGDKQEKRAPELLRHEDAVTRSSCLCCAGARRPSPAVVSPSTRAVVASDDRDSPRCRSDFPPPRRPGLRHPRRRTKSAQLGRKEVKGTDRRSASGSAHQNSSVLVSVSFLCSSTFSRWRIVELWWRFTASFSVPAIALVVAPGRLRGAGSRSIVVFAILQLSP
jgi:hypothetical protein